MRAVTDSSSLFLEYFVCSSNSQVISTNDHGIRSNSYDIFFPAASSRAVNFGGSSRITRDREPKSAKKNPRGRRYSRLQIESPGAEHDGSRTGQPGIIINPGDPPGSSVTKAREREKERLVFIPPHDGNSARKRERDKRRKSGRETKRRKTRGGPAPEMCAREIARSPGSDGNNEQS